MGYKSEQFVKKVDENLICPICQDVFKDPVSCKAGHTFCTDCITEWLKTNKKCPLDNRYLDENDLVRNLTASGIIDNLDVYCHPPASSKFSSVETCGWTGKLQDLDKHRKSCPFQQVQCPHENCNKIMERRAMEKHDKVCMLKMVKCKACSKDLMRQELEKHIKDDCPLTLILCPNNCTSAQGEITKIKRINVNRHLTNCASVVVDCPFKGCSVQVERQQVDKHVQENMAKHMMLLAKQNFYFNEICSSLTVQCSTLAEQNTQLDDELNKIKIENTQQKEEMKKVKIENTQIKEEMKKVKIENTQIKEEMKKVKESVSTYVWTIDDFPSLAKKYPHKSFFRSPTFWLCGNRWYLKIYPNGNNTESTGFLSLYLISSLNKDDDSQTSDAISIVANSKTCFSFRLSLISQEPGTEDVSFQDPTRVYNKTVIRGWRKFIKTRNALSSAYCSRADGSLTIQCTIQLVRPQ